ncbi:MAG: hypothetical protein ABH950_02270 [Candidatus Altiarchaeota archaeon]
MTWLRELVGELRQQLEEAKAAQTWEEQKNAVKEIQETIKELFKEFRAAVKEIKPIAVAESA